MNGSQNDDNPQGLQQLVKVENFDSEKGPNNEAHSEKSKGRRFRDWLFGKSKGTRTESEIFADFEKKLEVLENLALHWDFLHSEKAAQLDAHIKALGKDAKALREALLHLQKRMIKIENAVKGIGNYTKMLNEMLDNEHDQLKETIRAIHLRIRNLEYTLGMNRNRK